MVTYENLVQTGIFIVALIGLCFQVFRDKRKQPPHLAHVTVTKL